MTKQLAWIFRSYMTRPLFLMGLGVWMLFEFIMFVAIRLDTTPVPMYPQISPLPNSVVVENEEQLRLVRREGKEKEVTFLNIGAVQFIAPPGSTSITSIASEFPNAQAIIVDIPQQAHRTEDVVSQLGQFKHLRKLVLTGYVETLKELKPLEELKDILTLDISGLLVIHPSHYFPRIPSLMSLIVGPLNELNDQLLEAIATLPLLNDLVLIARFGDDSNTSITTAGIKSLRKCRTLKLLYVSQASVQNYFGKKSRTPEPHLAAGNRWNERQLVGTVWTTLGSNITVLRAIRTNEPPAIPFVIIGMSSVMGFFLGAHLASQRASILSWVAASHRSVPIYGLILWILLLSTISTCTTIMLHLSIANVFLLHTCFMTATAVAGLITFAPFLPISIRLVPALIFNVGIVSLIAIQADLQRIVPINDFARGAYQFEGSMVSFAVLAGLSIILSWVYFVHREYAPSVNPFRAIVRGESARLTDGRQPMTSKPPQRWLFKIYDQRLDDAITSNSLRTTSGQIERWRAAIPTGGWSWWGSMMVTIVAISLISSLLPPPLSGSARIGSLTPIFLMFPFMIGVAWRQRKRAMGFESLHPISRADFIRQIRTAFLRDLAPIFLWQAIIVVYIAYFGGIELLPIDIIRRSMILAPGLVLLLTAIAASIVLVRSGWGIGAIYAFVCIFFAITMSLIGVMFRNDQILWSVSLTGSIVGIIALIWMAFIWRRIELGR